MYQLRQFVIVVVVHNLAPENRHSGIAGPWTWTLDPENAGLWTDIAIQKHTGPKLIHVY